MGTVNGQARPLRWLWGWWFAFALLYPAALIYHRGMTIMTPNGAAITMGVLAADVVIGLRILVAIVTLERSRVCMLYVALLLLLPFLAPIVVYGGAALIGKPGFS